MRLGPRRRLSRDKCPGAATGTPPRCARPAFAFDIVNSGVREPPYDGGVLLPVCYVHEYRLGVAECPARTWRSTRGAGEVALLVGWYERFGLVCRHARSG